MLRSAALTDGSLTCDAPCIPRAVCPPGEPHPRVAPGQAPVLDAGEEVVDGELTFHSPPQDVRANYFVPGWVLPVPVPLPPPLHTGMIPYIPRACGARCLAAFIIYLGFIPSRRRYCAI